MDNETLNWFFKTTRVGSDEIGWGPSYYGSRHSLPACISLTSILLLGTTLVLVTAFVSCVITARRRRLVTLFQGSMLIGTGFALALGMVDLQWYVGRATLVSSYSMLDSGLIVQGNLEIYVGLLSYNTSYYSINASAPSMRFYYNDQFYFYFNEGVGPVQNKIRAINHGLPNPIITINEYLDTYGDGFEWGLQLPSAGYYAFHILTLASFMFATSVVLTFAVPEYSVRLFPITGIIMIASVATFGSLLPNRSRTIYIEGTPVNFYFGRAFFIVLLGGVVNLGTGILLLVLRKCLNFGVFSTFLEIDFDTPFDDRHLKADSERRRQNLNRFFADSRLRSSMRRFRDTIARKRDTVVFQRSRSQEPSACKAEVLMEHVTVDKKVSNTLTLEKKMSNTLTVCSENFVRIEHAPACDELNVSEMPEVLPFGAVSLPPFSRGDPGLRPGGFAAAARTLSGAGRPFRPRAHSEICVMPDDC